MKAVAVNFAVVDFETTGHVEGYPDEPWQVGVVSLRGGKLVLDDAWESLLRIGPRPFNAHAPGRHAALREDLARAPTPAECWPEVRRRLRGRPLAAHNAATEKNQLRRLAPLHRWGPWVDTLTLARIFQPGLPSYALEDLARTFGLEARLVRLLPGRTFHDALYDAAASALLLEHILDCPAWQEVSFDRLARMRPPRTG